ncbi:D-3-phosphoglycerate dehydrogenase [Cohaesibacter marisflavi]|uniref:D-3-phosphoglycerate dehydrogenase n=1 Tax=Cohaesibacter marisflavi TaxID=655353 RepID=A0A1I5E8B1_9HYPH|nr:NAD(P)-dependent oxidoreductase [Cohaesibacter marisflavi]SFO07789.1 D-3-phosphoglycerate dehydrogenase [Cohaesibacter marisflavi]
MKCLIVQPVHEEGLELLRQNGIEPVICPDPSMDTVAALAPGCESCITRNAGFTEQAFAAADKLKVVVVHGAGHDAVDKESATRHGVLVCNTPGANAQSVSELALGLALSAARLLPAADREERAGRFGFRDRNQTLELQGKTALVVGWGHTGSRLGEMLRGALDMRVLVHSPSVKDLGDFERASSLEAGLAEADLISLHTPLRPETRHMINKDSLALVKPGAILVNTARAGLVDEAALLDALDKRHLFAAGLDVYEEDAPLGALGRSDRVILAPHLGGATEEAMRRIAVASVENVLTALSGKRPATALNLD